MSVGVWLSVAGTFFPASHTGFTEDSWPRAQHSLGLFRRLGQSSEPSSDTRVEAPFYTLASGARLPSAAAIVTTLGRTLHRGTARTVWRRPRPRQSTATPGLRQVSQVARQAGELRIKVSSSLVVVCSCVCFTVKFSMRVIRTCGYWGGRSCLGQAWGRNRPGSYDCH